MRASLFLCTCQSHCAGILAPPARAEPQVLPFAVQARACAR